MEKSLVSSFFKGDKIIISDRNFCTLFYTNYPILHKSFELCPFTQTVLLDENDTEGFFLAHNQSPKISNFDIIFAISEQP